MLRYYVLGICLCSVVDTSTLNCEKTPFASDCRYELSSPTAVSIYRDHMCSDALIEEAVIGEHVYSARRIYTTSNEPGLCYSYSGNLTGDPESIKWTCSPDGRTLTQTPYNSSDCSGQKMSTLFHHETPFDTSLLSTILNGETCLARRGALGVQSVRFSTPMNESMRPVCVQGWQAMEHQVISMTKDKQLYQSKLRQVKDSLSGTLEQDKQDKIMFACAGLFCWRLDWHLYRLLHEMGLQ